MDPHLFVELDVIRDNLLLFYSVSVTTELEIVSLDGVKFDYPINPYLNSRSAFPDWSLANANG